MHLAVDKNTGYKFACKTINKAALKDSQEVSEIRNEIAVLDYVAGHPNIIQLRDVYEDSASIHLVMDLCDGGSLIDMLHREAPLPEPKAATIFRSVIKSVMHCHQVRGPAPPGAPGAGGRPARRPARAPSWLPR